MKLYRKKSVASGFLWSLIWFVCGVSLNFCSTVYADNFRLIFENKTDSPMVFNKMITHYTRFEHEYDFFDEEDNLIVKKEVSPVFDVSVTPESYYSYVHCLEKGFYEKNNIVTKNLDGMGFTIGKNGFFIRIKQDDNSSSFYPELYSEAKEEYQITETKKYSGSIRIIYFEIQNKEKKKSSVNSVDSKNSTTEEQ